MTKHRLSNLRVGRRLGIAFGAVGALVGFACGVGVALLFARKSGKETRQDISDMLDKGRRKSEELIDNPRAALLFHWDVLERQVRITGNVSRLSREQSESYFRTRPHGSQVGAWASRQSSVIGNRAELEEKVREASARFGDVVPLPEHWGGWSVVPYEFEFWQGRPDRLHDRIRYRRHATGWNIDRLSP